MFTKITFVQYQDFITVAEVMTSHVSDSILSTMLNLPMYFCMVNLLLTFELGDYLLFTQCRYDMRVLMFY